MTIYPAVTLGDETKRIFAAANYSLGWAIYHPPVNGFLAACLLGGGVLWLHASSYMFVGLALVFVTGRCCIPSTLTWGFVLAGVWTITDIARSTGVGAMPWGLMGYAHLDNPLLKSLYPMAGAHGVARIAWLWAALLPEGWAVLRPQPGRKNSRLKQGSVSLIARVRAAEAQKPMVRANNVGYSAFIDERGGGAFSDQRRWPDRIDGNASLKAEVYRLKAELKKAHEERDLLKKAATYFAKLSG